MTSSIQIKICGLTTNEAVNAAVELGADYVGFVYYPRSPRHVSFAQAAKLIKNEPDIIKTVLVCVDISDDEIEELFLSFSPDFLQLHGNESVARVSEIKQRFSLPVIKAIAVRNGDDIAAGMAYEAVADGLLFDAKAPETLSDALPGGNGLVFDWNLLKNRVFTVPWMLSGGLNAENVHEAICLSGAIAVDVSSSVESAPGIKDVKLIKEFIQAARK